MSMFSGVRKHLECVERIKVYEESLATEEEHLTLCKQIQCWYCRIELSPTAHVVWWEGNVFNHVCASVHDPGGGGPLA